MVLQAHGTADLARAELSEAERQSGEGGEGGEGDVPRHVVAGPEQPRAGTGGESEVEGDEDEDQRAHEACVSSE